MGGVYQQSLSRFLMKLTIVLDLTEQRQRRRSCIRALGTCRVETEVKLPHTCARHFTCSNGRHHRLYGHPHEAIVCYLTQSIQDNNHFSAGRPSSFPNMAELTTLKLIPDQHLLLVRSTPTIKVVSIPPSPPTNPRTHRTNRSSACPTNSPAKPSNKHNGI